MGYQLELELEAYESAELVLLTGINGCGRNTPYEVEPQYFEDIIDTGTNFKIGFAVQVFKGDINLDKA